MKSFESKVTILCILYNRKVLLNNQESRKLKVSLSQFARYFNACTLLSTKSPEAMDRSQRTLNKNIQRVDNKPISNSTSQLSIEQNSEMYNIMQCTEN